MIDNLATILFLIGVLILIGSRIYMQKSKTCTPKQRAIMSICALVSILFMGGAWILREMRNKEKYYPFPDDDYRYAIESGKLVGGTVYASYPENSPGLGWI